MFCSADLFHYKERRFLLRTFFVVLEGLRTYPGLVRSLLSSWPNTERAELFIRTSFLGYKVLRTASRLPSSVFYLASSSSALAGEFATHPSCSFDSSPFRAPFCLSNRFPTLPSSFANPHLLSPCPSGPLLRVLYGEGLNTEGRLQRFLPRVQVARFPFFLWTARILYCLPPGLTERFSTPPRLP